MKSKDSKQRLFEVVAKLDKTFIPKLNEEMSLIETKDSYKMIKDDFPGHAKSVNPIDSPQYKWYQRVLNFIQGDNNVYEKEELVKFFQNYFIGMDYDILQTPAEAVSWWLSPEQQEFIKGEMNAPELDEKFNKMYENIESKKSFILNLWGEDDEVHFELDNYSNNNALAVELVSADGEPYATVSVNVPGSEQLPKDEFFLKDWSENEPLAKALVDMGAIIPTGKRTSSGFIVAKSYKIAPEYLDGNVEEGWGKNLAAGAMMGTASLMPMNAQGQNTGVDDNKPKVAVDKGANRFEKRNKSYELAMQEYTTLKKTNPNYDLNNQIYKELMQWKKQLDDERKTYKFGAASQVNEGANDVDPTYTHFAVIKSTGKIVNGWEYKGYDPEELKQFKKDYFFVDIEAMDLDPKAIAIYTRKTLEREGTNPFDWNNWAKTEEMPFKQSVDEVAGYKSNNKVGEKIEDEIGNDLNRDPLNESDEEFYATQDKDIVYYDVIAWDVAADNGSKGMFVVEKAIELAVQIAFRYKNDTEVYLRGINKFKYIVTSDMIMHIDYAKLEEANQKITSTLYDSPYVTKNT